MSRTAPDGPDPLRPHSTRPALLGIEALVVTAAVVLAIVLIGRPTHVSVNSPADSGPRPAPASPFPKAAPSAKPHPSVHFNPTNREFLADGIQGTLPAGWFIGEGSFNIGAPGVGGCFGRGCTPNLVGQHPLEENIPWGAEFEVVKVEDALRGSDIEETADNLLSYWRKYTIFYTDTSGKVTVRNERKRTLTTNLPRPARLVTAELHYRKPGLRIRYDHFYLLVVKGTLGNYTAFAAAWSDNATADTVKMIQDSINSLEVV